MNKVLVFLLLLNFAYIGILPRIFFKKDGRYNLMWWVTAGPLFLNALVILSQYIGFIDLSPYWILSDFGVLGTVVLSSFSIGMISYTMGTHRIPLSLWHQNNDAPVNVVTWGAYKYIRHPFYSSFITTQIASVLLLPHIVTFSAMILCLLILNQTASREERRLSESNFGSEYKNYMTQSGRFFPKFGA